MKIECPMSYFHDNLIYTQQGDCYAGYEIKLDAYRHKSDPEKFTMRQRAQTMLKRTEAKHIKILGKPWTQSIRAGAEEFKSTFRGPLAHLAKNHVDFQTDYLISKVGDESNSIKKFMLVELKKSEKQGFGKILDDAKYLGSSLFDTVDSAFGVKNVEIPLEDMYTYTKREQTLYRRIGNFVNPIDEATTEWLQVQPFYRGIGEPKLRTKAASKYADDSGQKDFDPWKPGYEVKERKGKSILVPKLKDLLTLGGGVLQMNKTKPHLQISHNNGRISHQSFLSVSFIDDGLVFPDYEFFYWLESLNFPVEYEIDIDVMNTKTSRGQIKRQKNTVKDQIQHMHEGGDVPDSVYEGQREADELDNELQQTRSDYYKVNINICVFADDYDLMERRAQAVINYFDEYEIEMQRSVSDQGKFFVEFLPGSKKVTTAFTKRILPRVLCSGIFNATELLGDPFGFYIAALGSLEKPVFYDPSRAALNDKSPAISSIGRLGGGKTLLMLYLSYLNALAGNKSLFINPKGNSSSMREYLPDEFQEHLDIIMLSGETEFVGMLDPFLVYELANINGKELEEAKKKAFELAVTILCFIGRAKIGDRRYLAITKACKEALETDNPCMLRVEEFVNEGWKKHDKLGAYADEFSELSILIEGAKEFPATSLLFSEGKSKALNINRAMTVIDVQGLTMPDQGKTLEEFNTAETISLAVLMPLLEHAKRFGFSERDIVKFIGVDEQWFIKLVSMGQQFMESMVRQGRSLFTTIHLADQNATSIDDELKNNIGIKFIYKMGIESEAVSSLEYVGMEVNESNIKSILKMKDRHVLHQDLDGRTGIVRIDIPEDIVEAFSSRPEQRKGDGGDEKVA